MILSGLGKVITHSLTFTAGVGTGIYIAQSYIVPDVVKKGREKYQKFREWETSFRKKRGGGKDDD